MSKSVKLILLTCIIFAVLFYNTGFDSFDYNYSSLFQKYEGRSIDRVDHLENMDSNSYLSLDRMTYVDLGYSGSSINTSRFRQNALLDTEKGQFVAYFNANREAIIQLIKPNKEIFKLKIKPDLSNNLIGNGHCSINIGYDDEKIFVFYGAHAILSYFAVIPVDIFGKEDSFESKENSMLITYPQFYKINGELFLFFRQDTNPYNKTNEKYNDICFLKISGNTIKMEDKKTLIKANNYNSVYINEIGINNNMVVIPYMYRLESDGSNFVKNEGIYLIKSTDGGKSYKNLNDQKLVMPINFYKENRILRIDGDRNLMNQDGAYLTEDNYLLFTSIYDDKNGIPQINLTSVDLEKHNINTKVVTKNTIDYDLKGAGTVKTSLSRSVVVASEKYIHLIYRMDGKMTVASTKRLEGGDWDNNWEIIQPTKASLGYWEPLYDKDLWKEKKILDVFVQSTSQGDEDKAIYNKATDIFVYRFVENK